MCECCFLFFGRFDSYCVVVELTKTLSFSLSKKLHLIYLFYFFLPFFCLIPFLVIFPLSFSYCRKSPFTLFQFPFIFHFLFLQNLLSLFSFFFISLSCRLPSSLPKTGFLEGSRVSFLRVLMVFLDHCK